jgi:hypothetical protein
MKRLLDCGADVNAQGGEYGNALYAASCGGHEAVLKILMDKGMDGSTQGADRFERLSRTLGRLKVGGGWCYFKMR